MPPKYCANGKVCFDKKGAQSARNRRLKHDRIPLRIYPCGLGGSWHWHLTSHDPFIGKFGAKKTRKPTKYRENKKYTQDYE